MEHNLIKKGQTAAVAPAVTEGRPSEGALCACFDTQPEFALDDKQTVVPLVKREAFLFLLQCNRQARSRPALLKVRK